MPGYLCVGGPLDGKMCVANPSHTDLTVPVTRPIPLLPPSASWTDVPVHIEYVRYVRFTIGTPDGPATFWAPDGTRPIDMLNTLAKGYKP